MTSTWAGHPSNRILVGVDWDTTSIVLDWAAREAWLRSASMHVVNVWPPLRPLRPSTDPAQAAQEIVDAAERHLSGVTHLTGEPVCGEAGHVLVALSATASLLVLGSSRRQGNGGLLLGGVAQHCVRQAHCPVTVVPMGWHEMSIASTELTGMA